MFVISLPDCTKRRARITPALQKLKIGFDFFDAVDGRGWLDPVWEIQIDRSGNPMIDIEYACALSHINVYCHIVTNAIPYVLVLEDDATPHPDLPRFLAGEHCEKWGIV